MKRSFFLLCAVLFVLGSLLPLAGYRLAKTVLGPSAPASSAAAPEPETPDAASLPPSDRDSETFLIADQSDGAVVSVTRRDYLIGAVAAEMPITWPDEALKAQAIAAHSYALYCRDHAQDPAAGWLTADPARRQGYLTDAVLRSYWGTAYEANYARLSALVLSLIHISEPTRRTPISYAVFCLKKKKFQSALMSTLPIQNAIMYTHLFYNTNE